MTHPPGDIRWANTCTNPISTFDMLGIGASNPHKPTFTQLRAEGLSEHAIETLMLGRDAIATMSAAEVAEFLSLSHRHHPVDVDDVWPLGVPAHWMNTADYDPTDAELEAAWNGPDAHEAHRAAWRLHQGLHERSAS
jgi:hypothetical protein